MPSATKTSAPKRKPRDTRMAVVKWARANGACHIKVDGIELVFPPNMHQMAPKRSLTPEEIAKVGSNDEDLDANAPLPITSQHPDEYAEQSDRWASWRR